MRDENIGVTISTLPNSGVLVLSGVPVTAGQVILSASITNLTWTPVANANGTGIASFTFAVTDNGGTANGGVNTDPTPNTITFNVTPVNDAPILSVANGANLLTNGDFDSPVVPNVNANISLGSLALSVSRETGIVQ